MVLAQLEKRINYDFELVHQVSDMALAMLHAVVRSKSGLGYDFELVHQVSDMALAMRHAVVRSMSGLGSVQGSR